MAAWEWRLCQTKRIESRVEIEVVQGESPDRNTINTIADLVPPLDDKKQDCEQGLVEHLSKQSEAYLRRLECQPSSQHIVIPAEASSKHTKRAKGK